MPQRGATEFLRRDLRQRADYNTNPAFERPHTSGAPLVAAAHLVR